MSAGKARQSFEAAKAMLQHQADPPPAIIHTLRVLLDPEAYPHGHAKWVEDGARAILKNWERAEDPAQLKSDLGLVGPKRRKERTMLRETTIAAAVADSALAGDGDPRKAARIKLKTTARDVRAAWKKWGPIYIQRLRELNAPSKERRQIMVAITALEKLSKEKN